MLASILEIYNFDPTIFDGLKLPKLSDIRNVQEIVNNPFIPSKDLLIGHILMNLAEISVVYTDPAILKRMIEIWSNVRFQTWLPLYETLLYKYNPIWNKDGTWTETRNLGVTESETTDRDTTTTGRTDDDTTRSAQTTGSRSVSDDLDISGTTGGSKRVDDDLTIDRTTTGSRTTGGTSTTNDQTSGTSSRTVAETANGNTKHDVTGYDYNNFAEPDVGGGYTAVGYAPDTQDRSASSRNTTENGTTGATGSSTTQTSGTESTSGSEDAAENRDITETTTGTENRTEDRDISETTGGTESGTENRDITTTGSGTEDVQRDGTRSENETVNHREYGNIGVTTTQSMIEEQRKLVEFNFYDYILRDFKNQFCVMVY